MTTGIETGEMLREFTFALLNIQLWSAEPLKTFISEMYESRNGEDGDIAIIVRSDIRALLFSGRTQEHMHLMLNLIKDGITGTAALEQAIRGTTSPAITSGTL